MEANYTSYVSSLDIKLYLVSIGFSLQRTGLKIDLKEFDFSTIGYIIKKKQPRLQPRFRHDGVAGVEKNSRGRGPGRSICDGGSRWY